MIFWPSAAIILVLVAWLRGPEYDEAYSIFLTAGHARPLWPHGVFSAGSVRWLYEGHASLVQIALNLRKGDVHPPLYFWALELWRSAFGPAWFMARLLSVLFTLAGLVGLLRIACLCRLPAWPVLAMTLLSYGFCYTGILVRPFALAQLFNIFGVWLALLALRQQSTSYGWLAGLCLGAAAFSDYLALFTGVALLLWLLQRHKGLALRAGLAMLPFLLAAFWFFLAQRASRTGQFSTFTWHAALALLGRDGGAALFGGLPLYAGWAALPVVVFLGCLTLVGAGLALRHAQGRGFLALAAATPIGLLLLGIIFNATPIEIRYLAFALPWVALGIAPYLPRMMLNLWLVVQALAVAGLMLAPSTMQPQGRAAHLAALYKGEVVALPFGNDGVGVPGPFIAAAPDSMRIILLHPGQAVPPHAVRVAIKVDAKSRAVTAEMNCPRLVCGP